MYRPETAFSTPDMNHCDITDQTRCWLEKIVMGFRFCPFASQPFLQQRIRYAVCHHDSLELCMTQLVNECIILDNDSSIETTLLIFSQALQNFDDYLDALELAQQLLVQQGYEGTYQLAGFHPQYRFADSDDNDAANYTNRSPWPMLHLLRENSIEKALSSYTSPDTIPEHNIAFCRSRGIAFFQAMLDECIKLNSHK